MATPPTFSAGAVLTAAQMNQLGMFKTADLTFSGSSGVELQDCFSSDFNNYLVQVVYYGSASTNTQTRFIADTGTIDTAATYNRFGFYWNNGVNGFNQSANTSDFVINHGSTATDPSTAQITIYSPNLATRTMTTSNGYSGDSGLTTFLSFNKATTTTYTGLYFFPTSGTITGKITVYGLRN